MAGNTRTPTRPTSPKRGTTSRKPSSGSSGSSGKGSSGGGGGGGGGGSAESRAVARENAAKSKAGKRYLEAAANLELQAKALRHALKYDLSKKRDNDLGDVSRTLNTQISQLKLGLSQRAKTFLDAAGNTEKATAGQAEGSFSNRVRERADSMAAVLEHGAGETDTARAMLLAARNWQANTSEGNRAYFDSLQSVNAGITDLNVDTRGALSNAWTSAEGERDRLWREYYDNRSQTYTNLGNTLGQQADYYAQAKEMGVKPKKGAEKKAEKSMGNAWMAASKESGKSYTQKTLPDWIAKYEGAEQVETRLSNTNLAAAMDVGQVVKAEGSSLRRWGA